MIFLPEGISDFSDPKETAFASPTIGTVIAAPSSNRVYLLIQATITGFFIAKSKLTVPSTGIPLPTPGNQPLKFTWHDDCVMVTSGWVINGSVAGNVVVYEIFYRPVDR